MLDEGKVFLTGRAQESLVAGAEDRAMSSATITKPGQSKEGQTTMTVSVPQDSNKRKVEPRDDTSQTPQKNKRHF